MLLMLPKCDAGLRCIKLSVRLSVCLSRRSIAAGARAAAEGSVVLKAKVPGSTQSTQTCIKMAEPIRSLQESR